jgi:hypothetical protein
MERVFRVINRINSVLFLLLVLAVGAFIAFQIALRWSGHRDNEVTAVEMDADQTPREVVLTLGMPTTVTGSETVMLRLFGTRKSSSGMGSKGGYGDLRNVLFVKPDGSSTWLLTENGNRIVDLHEVGPSDFAQAGENYDSNTAPTKLLLVSIVALREDEAGGDGRRPIRIALAKPDGSSLVEVLKDVDELLTYWLAPSGTLSLYYQTGASVHRAQYAVDTLKETSNITVTELPKTL